MSTAASVCLPLFFFLLSLACLKMCHPYRQPPLFIFSAFQIRNCNDLLLSVLDWLTGARIEFLTQAFSWNCDELRFSVSCKRKFTDVQRDGQFPLMGSINIGKLKIDFRTPQRKNTVLSPLDYRIKDCCLIFS